MSQNVKTFARRTAAKLLNISDRQVSNYADEAKLSIGRAEAGVKARLYTCENLFDIAAFKREKEKAAPLEKRIITVNVPRGGTGKTLIATNLAVCFALEGIKTCLIDLDFQASATLMFGYNADMDDEIAKERGLPPEKAVNFHCGHLLGLTGSQIYPFEKVVKYPYGKNGPALIPADVTLSRMDNQLTAERLNTIDKVKGDLALMNLFIKSPDFKDFEVIILDTGPGQNRIITSALTASNMVLAPIGLERVSDKGLGILMTSLEAIENESGIKPEMRVIPNMMVDTIRALQELKHISNRYQGSVVPVAVRRSEEVARSYTGESEEHDLYPFVLTFPSSEISSSLKSVTTFVANELWPTA